MAALLVPTRPDVFGPDRPTRAAFPTLKRGALSVKRILLDPLSHTRNFEPVTQIYEIAFSGIRQTVIIAFTLMTEPRTMARTDLNLN